jgi:hypothetical protein
MAKINLDINLSTEQLIVALKDGIEQLELYDHCTIELGGDVVIQLASPRAKWFSLHAVDCVKYSLATDVNSSLQSKHSLL